MSSKVFEIAESELSASKKLQKLTILLQNAEIVNSILMICIPSRTASTAKSINAAKSKVQLGCGQLRSKWQYTLWWRGGLRKRNKYVQLMGTNKSPV